MHFLHREWQANPLGPFMSELDSTIWTLVHNPFLWPHTKCSGVYESREIFWHFMNGIIGWKTTQHGKALYYLTQRISVGEWASPLNSMRCSSSAHAKGCMKFTFTWMRKLQSRELCVCSETLVPTSHGWIRVQAFVRSWGTREGWKG